MLSEGNENITLTGEEAIEIVTAIDYFCISLNQMGHYYDEKATTKEAQYEFERELCRFIIENRVGNQLWQAGSIISSKFNTELGDDDMDDLERETENVTYWEKPGD